MKWINVQSSEWLFLNPKGCFSWSLSDGYHEVEDTFLNPGLVTPRAALTEDR